MSAVRVSYHGRDRHALIAEPLRRSYEALRSQHPEAAVFLRSGWLHGPHLDLCVVGAKAEPDLAAHVAEVQAWVDAHPSMARLSAESYEQASLRLGALEGVPGPYGPLREDNRVEPASYRPPRLVDGHETLQAEYVQFFHRATPVVFALAERRQAGGGLFFLALAALLGRTASRLQPHGLGRGYISLQAHADFFFANFDGDGRARAHFERLESQWGAALDDIVWRSEPAGVLPAEQMTAIQRLARDWDDVLSETEAAVRASARQESGWFYYNPSAFDGDHVEEHAASFAAAGMSEKIKKGETLEGIWEDIDHDFFSSENFQVFRILLNMFYSMLPVLSVSPAERFGLCFLVANAARRSLL